MRLVRVSGPSSTRIPRSRSCRASSRRVGPPRPGRSRVGSPPSSNCQFPCHRPLAESSRPLPMTLVEMRAPPPARARVKPVVNSLAVEAGISSSSGFRLHRIRPSMVPIAMPHWPSPVRTAVRRYQSSTRARSPGVSSWAARMPAEEKPLRKTMTSAISRRRCTRRLVPVLLCVVK